MQLPEALSVLRNRHFRVYWIGQTVSLVGTWMQQMAQGWVVTRITTQASALGILMVVGSLPIVLLGLKGGQFADRYNKRNILIVHAARIDGARARLRGAGIFRCARALARVRAGCAARCRDRFRSPRGTGVRSRPGGAAVDRTRCRDDAGGSAAAA